MPPENRTLKCQVHFVLRNSSIKLCVIPCVWPNSIPPFGVNAKNEKEGARDSTMNVRKQQIAQTENVYECEKYVKHFDGKIEQDKCACVCICVGVGVCV